MGTQQKDRWPTASRNGGPFYFLFPNKYVLYILSVTPNHLVHYKIPAFKKGILLSANIGEFPISLSRVIWASIEHLIFADLKAISVPLIENQTRRGKVSVVIASLAKVTITYQQLFQEMKKNKHMYWQKSSFPIWRW